MIACATLTSTVEEQEVGHMDRIRFNPNWMYLADSVDQIKLPPYPIFWNIWYSNNYIGSKYIRKHRIGLETYRWMDANWTPSLDTENYYYIFSVCGILANKTGLQGPHTGKNGYFVMKGCASLRLYKFQNSQLIGLEKSQPSNLALHHLNRKDAESKLWQFKK